MRARILLSLAVSSAVAVLAVACGSASTPAGGGGPTPAGSGTPNPTPTPPANAIASTPSDTSISGATSLGGAGTWWFTGTCVNAGDSHYFSVTSTQANATAMLNASLWWVEEPALDDMAFSAYNQDQSIYYMDTRLPPDDDPGQVTVAVTTAGTLYLEVDCLNSYTSNLPYIGSVTVP